MYSSAFNSLGHLSGSADPKTGTFSFKQSFGKLQADAGLGPALDLSMSFSPLGTMSGNLSGLGRGWSFKLANYSDSGKILTLNSGAAYTVLNELSTPWDLSHKLQDIHVKKKDSEILIYHKSGDIEILEIDEYSRDAYITSYVSALGRFLKFEYYQESGYNRLTKVSDSSSTLATVDYDDNSFTATITVYPNTPEEKQYILNFESSGCLYNLQLPQNQETSFEYKIVPFPDGEQNVTLYLLNKVTYPNGSTEQIEYDEQLYLPTGAPIPYLPAVSTHTKFLADSQPHITTTFSYGNDSEGELCNNFWGYNAGIVWQDNYDQLFDYTSEYNYSSQTSCGDAVTKYTFNKFHQALTKVETFGSSLHKKVTTFNHFSNGGAPLSKQPKIYELVKQHSVKYVTPTGESREFVQSYVYDDFGNITSKTEVNGVTTKYKYYPSGGAKGCPPHPFGLVVFPQQKIVMAADGSESKTTTYTYQSIPQVNHTDTCVVPLSKNYMASSNSFTYFDKSNPNVQCAIKSHAMTIGNKTTTKSFSFEFANGKTCITATVTGHDGTTSSSSKTHSSWSGLTLQDVNSAGVTTKYSYDITGRLKSQNTSGSSGIVVTATYTYTDKPPSLSQSGATQIGTLVVKNTSAGVVEHTYYNGEHHELSVYQQDQYSILRKASEKQYDKQGRVQLKTEYDYEISETDHSVQKTYTNSSFYAYGCWGEVKETKNSEGIIKLVIVDHVNMQTTTQLVRRDDLSHPEKVTSSLAQTVTSHDLFGNPTKVERIDISGATYSTSSFEYDGFGRKLSATMPTGTTTSVTKYDGFNRPAEFKQADGTIITTSYVEFSPMALVSSVYVPSCDFIVGQQDFDGLMRVTGRKINGIKTHFSYEGGQKKPARKLNGRGQTILFDYMPELDYQPKRIGFYSKDVPAGRWNDESKVSENVYTYADNSSSHTGHIVSVSGSSGKYEYEYSATGLIQKVTQVVGSHSKEITNDKVSLLGKPLSVFVGSNRKVTLEYDDHGIPTATTDSSVRAETTYDAFGRVVKIVLKQFNGKSFEFVQSTDIGYDEFSRETMRTISTKQILSIKSIYDAADKITQRIITLNGKDSLTENFTYDDRNRLIFYHASNYTSETLLPCNENDRPFISQKFTFNVLDNITTIVTTFPSNGGYNTATFLYDQENKQQLKQINNSLATGENAYPPIIAMTYDADGNMLSMKDTKMTYTISGHMSSKNNDMYSYDPYERLVKTNETIRFYSGSSVVQEFDTMNTTEFIRDANVPIAEVQNGKYILYGLDNKSSTVLVTDDNSTKHTTYAPYGTGDNGARMGMNGYLRDVTNDGTYPLGNGTRFFWPVISGFSAADSFSPFHGGGLNPYRYCNGDPINAIDPSGHEAVPWWHWLLDAIAVVAAVASFCLIPFTGGLSIGLGVAVLGATFGVASASLSFAADAETSEGNTALAKKLSIAAAACGVASAVCAVGGVTSDVEALTSAAEDVASAADSSATTSDEIQSGVDNVLDSEYNASEGTSNPETLNKESTEEVAGGGEEGNNRASAYKRFITSKGARKTRLSLYAVKVTNIGLGGYKLDSNNNTNPPPNKRNSNGIHHSFPVSHAIVSKSVSTETSRGHEGNSPKGGSEKDIQSNTISAYGIPPNNHLKW